MIEAILGEGSTDSEDVVYPSLYDEAKDYNVCSQIYSNDKAKSHSSHYSIGCN